jgi:putative transposase
MRKDGRTKQGRQRWRCADCGLRTTVRRRDAARRAQLEEFLSWLLGAAGQPQGRERGFRKRTAWCWDLQPYIVPDGRPHPVVMADGTYVGHDHCLLVACDGISGRVLAWRWCAREDCHEYAALFSYVAQAYGVPRLLVSDGMRGIPAAVRAAWPGCVLQRCLEHVRRDCRTDLTLRPRTQAGRELSRIAALLAGTRDEQSARLFLQALNAWHNRWGGYIKEKTLYMPGTPGWAPGGPRWGWTHERVRRCYMRLQRLSRAGELFRFLDPCLTEELGDLPCTSNRLEGGINSPIKRMLLNHRGMPETHMLKACEWMCQKHSGQPLPPIDSMLPHNGGQKEQADDDGAPRWGTSPDWDELHTRTRYPYATD